VQRKATWESECSHKITSIPALPGTAAEPQRNEFHRRHKPYPGAGTLNRDCKKRSSRTKYTKTQPPCTDEQGKHCVPWSVHQLRAQ
jgi:hypothetical protein